MKITLQGVTKVIKGRTVLDNVSYSFESGHVYGLKGANGSGKTMLMRAIAGLIYPTSGSIQIDGLFLHKDIDFPPSIGILIENPSFLNSYTGYQNLQALAMIKNIVNREQIQEHLCFVGLDPNDKRTYKKYSLGMKQRLGIAAAILEDPAILLLDEPLNALDEKGIPIIESIIETARRSDKIVILSCHDSAALEAMADCVLVMQEARLCT